MKNFKVKCVYSKYTECMVGGKIYEVKNGKFIREDGSVSYGYYHDFDELQRRLRPYQIIKLINSPISKIKIKGVKYDE